MIAAGIVLSLAGNIPAIRGALRRTSGPQILSWAGWAAIMVIAGAGTLAAGQLASGVYVLACAAGSGLVALFALRVPARKRDEPARVSLPGGRRVRLDLVCLPGALAGLALLAAAWRSGWPVGVSAVTDAIVFVPTFAHGWRLPWRESLTAFTLFAAGSAAVLAHAAAAPGFAGLAYPAYLTLSDGGMAVMLVLLRLTRMPRRPA